MVRSAARVLALLSRPNGATITAHGDAKPLSAAGYRAAMGVTQATFIDAVRCALEVAAHASRGPGGLRPVDLDAMAEAAWETFVEQMREASGG